MYTHGPSQPKLTMTTASNLDKHCGCGIGLRLDQTCVKNNAVTLPRPCARCSTQRLDSVKSSGLRAPRTATMIDHRSVTFYSIHASLALLSQQTTRPILVPVKFDSVVPLSCRTQHSPSPSPSLKSPSSLPYPAPSGLRLHCLHYR